MHRFREPHAWLAAPVQPNAEQGGFCFSKPGDKQSFVTYAANKPFRRTRKMKNRCADDEAKWRTTVTHALRTWLSKGTRPDAIAAGAGRNPGPTGSVVARRTSGAAVARTSFMESAELVRDWFGATRPGNGAATE